MLVPVYNEKKIFHFEITFHCDQFLMCVVVGQPGYVVLHELCVCGFWSTQKENEKYGNEVGTLTSTTSIFSDKLLFLSSDTEKRRRQFVTWISLYQNVQKWSDHRCTTIFRNKEEYAWWNFPAKCSFFFIFMFTLVFSFAKWYSFLGEKLK